MIPFSSSYEFYDQLARDYKEKLGRDQDAKQAKRRDNDDNKSDDADKLVRQSFLYQYFRQKKNLEALRVCYDKALLFSTKDKYTLVKGAHHAYRKHIITEAEYREKFLLANKSTKSGQKKRAELFETEHDKAQEQLEDRLLRDCAERFIDNTLHTQRFDKYSDSKSNKANPARKEKYSDVIEMLYNFCIYKNSESESPASTVQSDLNEKYIEICADLHELIRREDKWRCVFVPLYIDKDSGAGVYLIGKSHFETFAEDFTEEYVAVCVLSFSDIVNVNTKETNISVSMKYKIHDSVVKAFAEFKNDLISKTYFDEYALNNDDEFPSGADEYFRSRFINDRVRSEIIESEARKETRGIEQMKENEAKNTQ